MQSHIASCLCFCWKGESTLTPSLSSNTPCARSHYGRTNARMVRSSNPSRVRKFSARLRDSLGDDSAINRVTRSRRGWGNRHQIWREGGSGGALDDTRGMCLMTALPSKVDASRSSSPRPPRPGGVGEMMMEVAHRPSQFAQISTRSQFPKLCWSVQGSAKECSLGCVNSQPE